MEPRPLKKTLTGQSDRTKGDLDCEAKKASVCEKLSSEGDHEVREESEEGSSEETDCDEVDVIMNQSQSSGISPSIINCYLCWVCLRKFKSCLEVKSHILQNHSKAFCALAQRESKDSGPQQQLLLFCPKDCKYVTSNTGAISRHIGSCQKPELQTDGLNFTEIQSNFILQEYNELKECVASGAIIDVKKEREYCSSSAEKECVASGAKNDVKNEMECSSSPEKECVASDANIDVKNEMECPSSPQKESVASDANIDVKNEMECSSSAEKECVASGANIDVKNEMECSSSIENECAASDANIDVKKEREHYSSNAEKESIQRDTSSSIIESQNETDQLKLEKDVDFGTLTRGSEELAGKEIKIEVLNTRSIEKSKDTHPCQECNMVFTTALSLEGHMEKVHTQDKEIKLETSETSSPSQEPQTDCFQTKVKTKGFLLQCVDCDMSFNSKELLRVHKRIHSGKKSYECELCGKSYGDRRHFNTHMRTHTGEKPYKCKICPKAFGNSGSLSLHTRTHTGEKPFICSVCGNCYTRNEHLKRHMSSHTGEKPYICSICNKSFHNSGNLCLHIRTHTGEKPFHCKYCTKCFCTSGELRKHTRIHTGEKPFECKECGKNFKLRGHLNTHMKTHTGEKPFHCPQCERKFTMRGHLNAHIRTHTGEKPFPCRECDKTFRTSSNLQLHMKTHERGQPYKCSECGENFRTGGEVRKHIRIHTSKKSKTNEAE